MHGTCEYCMPPEKIKRYCDSCMHKGRSRDMIWRDIALLHVQRDIKYTCSSPKEDSDNEAAKKTTQLYIHPTSKCRAIWLCNNALRNLNKYFKYSQASKPGVLSLHRSSDPTSSLLLKDNMSIANLGISQTCSMKSAACPFTCWN